MFGKTGHLHQILKSGLSDPKPVFIKPPQKAGNAFLKVIGHIDRTWQNQFDFCHSFKAGSPVN